MTGSFTKVASVLAGLLLGTSLAAGQDFPRKQIELVVPFALIFVVLLVKPNGLFGRNVVERV